MGGGFWYILRRVKLRLWKMGEEYGVGAREYWKWVQVYGRWTWKSGDGCFGLDEDG